VAGRVPATRVYTTKPVGTTGRSRACRSSRDHRDRLLETYAPSAPETITVRSTPIKNTFVRSVAFEAASKESIVASFPHPLRFLYGAAWVASIAKTSQNAAGFAEEPSAHVEVKKDSRRQVPRGGERVRASEEFFGSGCAVDGEGRRLPQSSITTPHGMRPTGTDTVAFRVLRSTSVMSSPKPFAT
jgi:hypothetical protein